jgi:hypothetical protein
MPRCHPRSASRPAGGAAASVFTVRHMHAPRVCRIPFGSRRGTRLTPLLAAVHHILRMANDVQRLRHSAREAQRTIGAGGGGRSL